MNQSFIPVALALAALWGSGCGTIQNLRSGEDMTPYGGLVKDSPGDMLLALDRPPPEGSRPFNNNPLAIIIIVPIAVGEVCLTCIGDTLTLPLTCYVQAQRSRQEQSGHVGYGVAVPQSTDADRGIASGVQNDSGAPKELGTDDPTAWSSLARNCLGPMPTKAGNGEIPNNTLEPAGTDNDTPKDR